MKPPLPGYYQHFWGVSILVYETGCQKKWLTVKFLNFQLQKNFAVIYLKFKQRPNLRVLCQNDANGIANSEDPDQTAPVGAV